MNAVFFKLSHLMDIGNFHVRSLPHYLADIEYSYRAMKKGYKFIQDDSVKVKWDMETTGIHETKDLTFKVLLKLCFQKNIQVILLVGQFFIFIQ